MRGAEEERRKRGRRKGQEIFKVEGAEELEMR
jgi:hypothetical protein